SDHLHPRSHPTCLHAHGARRRNAASHRTDARNIVAAARAAGGEARDVSLRLSRAVQRRARAARALRAVVRPVRRAFQTVTLVRAARAPRRRRSAATGETSTTRKTTM